MHRRTLRIALCSFLILAVADLARGQQPDTDTTSSKRRERIGDSHWKLVGSVEIERGDTKLYADEAEYFAEQHRAIATGNVVFQQGTNRIAADRADFNTETRL